MARRQIKTQIGGVTYYLTQLGGDQIAELGDQIIEATALTGRGVPALAASNRSVRNALIAVSLVEIVDEDDPGKKRRTVALDTVFDDHFAGARAADLGKWFAWAVKESGLPAFLGGALTALVPSLLARLPSEFRPVVDGSPTASSSPSA
jgi:hypothetical protein